jgi:hypothetical protein
VVVDVEVLLSNSTVSKKLFGTHPLQIQRLPRLLLLLLLLVPRLTVPALPSVLLLLLLLSCVVLCTHCHDLQLCPSCCQQQAQICGQWVGVTEPKVATKGGS